MKSIILLVLICLSLQETKRERQPQELYDVINPWTPGCPYDATQVIKEFSIEFAFYYAWFTSYAYCQNDFLEAGKCCTGQLPNNDWIMVDHGFGQVSFKDNEGNDVYGENNYVIWQSDVHKKFVLGFTGTREGMMQYIEQGLYTSLISIDSLNPRYKANEYVVAWMKKIIDKLYSPEHIAIFRSHPDYQVVFTGHSLGGAASVYMAMMMLYWEKYNFNSLNRPVVLTFGGYRSLNGDLVDFLESQADVYRVIHIADGIPEFLPCLRETGKKCSKNQNYYVHAGRMYLLDHENNYVSHCHYDYEDVQDYVNCYDDGSVVDPDAHNSYFHNRVKISARCGAISFEDFAHLDFNSKAK